ncbi:hypothetical protein XA68_13314 [Ophiocordyceps unilateralis]|uniref:Uncharacterized protein n=1 Tax=Ophiocordyceps unilateralis TaxID=268505 RepID=A0A2A9PD19_OPHUN|nr:hypothetical protein XA68_13314 [Ophiocordyceps unilateralis]
MSVATQLNHIFSRLTSLRYRSFTYRASSTFVASILTHTAKSIVLLRYHFVDDPSIYLILPKSNAVIVALALIGIVAAGPDPEQPHIYFPRNEVTRQTFNSTSSTSHILTTTENGLSTDPDSSSSSLHLLDELVSSLLRSATEATSSDRLDDSIVTPVGPPALTDAPSGTGGLPYATVASTSIKSMIGSTQRPEPTRQDGTQEPSSVKPNFGSTQRQQPSSQDDTHRSSSDKSEPGSTSRPGPSSQDGTQRSSSDKLESGSTQRPQPSSQVDTQRPSSDKLESGSTQRPQPSSQVGTQSSSDKLESGSTQRPQPSSQVGTQSSSDKPDFGSTSNAAPSSQGTLQRPSSDKPEFGSTSRPASSSQGTIQRSSLDKTEPGSTQRPELSSHDSSNKSSTRQHEAASTYKPGPSSYASPQASTSGKPEPTSTSRSDPTRHSHLDLPSDAGIVIGPNGIVTPTPSSSSRLRDDSSDSRPPTTGHSAEPSVTENETQAQSSATGEVKAAKPPVVGLRKGTKSPATDKGPELPGADGSLAPTPRVNGSSLQPNEPSTTSSSTKDGILAPVGNLASGLLPVPTANTVSSASSAVYSSAPTSVPTTKAGLSAPSDVDGNRPIPIPSISDVFSRPGGTAVRTTSASASSTETSIPSSVITSIENVAPTTSRTAHLPDSDGVVSSPTSRSDSTEPEETSTNGLLPAVTSKAAALTSLVPAVNSILPPPANSTAPSTLSNLTVGSTSSVSDPTIPPPIPVLPTGTAPTATSTSSVPTPVSSSDRDIAADTFMSSNSSAAYTPPETASPTKSDGLLPLVTSLLLTQTSSTAQTSSDLPLNTTLAVLPTATSQPPTLTSGLFNATTASTVAEVPVTSATSTQITSSSQTAETSGPPTIAPVTNATSSVEPSSQSLKPTLNTTSTLEPTVSSTGPATTELLLTTSVANTTEAASKTTSLYRFPHSSPSIHTASSSSSLSSLHPTTTVGSIMTSDRPSLTAVTTERKPSLTAVTTERKPSSTVVTTERKPSSTVVTTERKPSSTVVSQQLPTSSSASQPPSEAPQPAPTNFPKYIAPSKPAALAPVGTRNITIALNNIVMYNEIDIISTFNITSRLLPSLLSLSLAPRSADKIVIFSLERCVDSVQPFSVLAHTSFPDDDGFVRQLQLNLGLANSPIYTTDAAELTKVIEKNLKASGQSITPTDTQAALKLRDNLDKFHNITVEHCVARGSEKGATSGGDLGSNGDVQNAPNPGNQTEKEKLTTMGVAFGVVGAGFMYGAAMFIIARRYKRKRQTHRRSSSVSNSQDSSEMQQAGGASPPLMGGALPSRDYFSYGAEGRDSRGSGRSGMANSGRTANISAPVAAENSLGWN